MKKGIALIAFTDRGMGLAKKLAVSLGGEAERARDGGLAAWTAAHFQKNEALIFVGAVGIAVRAIAPHVRNKAEDPAVVCVDETGRWAVPLLSGHLGGANELARAIAALTGGEAVVTTATDINGLFAVDLWARKQGMAVLQRERIKAVSAKLLRGGTVTIESGSPIQGEPPAGVLLGKDGDVLVSYRAADTPALQLVPRVLTLGVGCRRGTEAETLEAAFQQFCAERGALPQAIEAAASIDLKADETGLLRFCAAHGWTIRFYSAEELRTVPGNFTASAFVESTAGVDNVCERAAVLSSGGSLIENKYARAGVTFALAERPVQYDWSW